MRHCKSSWLLNSHFKAALTLEAKEDDGPEVKTVKSALRILFETAWQGTIPVFKAVGKNLPMDLILRPVLWIYARGCPASSLSWCGGAPRIFFKASQPFQKLLTSD